MGQNTPSIMLPVFFLMCFVSVSRSQGHVLPLVGRNGGQNEGRNVGFRSMPNLNFVNGPQVGNAQAIPRFVDNNIRQAVLQNVGGANVRPAVLHNVGGANVRSAGLGNVEVGPRVVQNIPRQNVLQNVASANQQPGLARILPFPNVIPQIPEPPSVSVPNPGPQGNRLAFDEFGQQLPNQLQVQTLCNTRFFKND
ncbi:uncharacterized protein LOC117332225 [Pecten maximus]|uniref:uncharacterized protein LOC117332225 n=1 Tax=Pecten maximus TaxID=6579 RepID=UPI0014583FDD|nr:uncharacterized protein LOC117332225 [Pecten maximus]